MIEEILTKLFIVIGVPLLCIATAIVMSIWLIFVFCLIYKAGVIIVFIANFFFNFIEKKNDEKELEEVTEELKKGHPSFSVKMIGCVHMPSVRAFQEADEEKK